MNEVSLTAIMIFHFDAAITMIQDILDHDLVKRKELHEILRYKEKDSESLQEERLWKVLQGFLIRSVPSEYPPELRGPDVPKD